MPQQFETPKYMVMAFELMEGGDLFGYLTSLPHSAMSEVRIPCVAAHTYGLCIFEVDVTVSCLMLLESSSR